MKGKLGETALHPEIIALAKAQAGFNATFLRKTEPPCLGELLHHARILTVGGH
jgi:hypothetical protein